MDKKVKIEIRGEVRADKRLGNRIVWYPPFKVKNDKKRKKKLSTGRFDNVKVFAKLKI